MALSKEALLYARYDTENMTIEQRKTLIWGPLHQLLE